MKFGKALEALEAGKRVQRSGKVVPWLCSQTDMLADDWELLE